MQCFELSSNLKYTLELQEALLSSEGEYIKAKCLMCRHLDHIDAQIQMKRLPQKKPCSCHSLQGGFVSFHEQHCTFPQALIQVKKYFICKLFERLEHFFQAGQFSIHCTVCSSIPYNIFALSILQEAISKALLKLGQTISTALLLYTKPVIQLQKFIFLVMYVLPLVNAC